MMGKNLTDEDVAALRDAVRVFEKIKDIQQHAQGDWIDNWKRVEIVSTVEAGIIAGCSPETIRRRCVEAVDVGSPIGVQYAGTWFVSVRRLLDDIELRDGRPARLTAETNVGKIQRN
jgi:hypothetical protein